MKVYSETINKMCFDISKNTDIPINAMRIYDVKCD